MAARNVELWEASGSCVATEAEGRGVGRLKRLLAELGPPRIELSWRPEPSTESDVLTTKWLNVTNSFHVHDDAGVSDVREQRDNALEDIADLLTRQGRESDRLVVLKGWWLRETVYRVVGENGTNVIIDGTYVFVSEKT